MKESVRIAPWSQRVAAGASRKKTAAAIHQEVAREINQLLGRIFAQRHKDGRTDLEAIETAVRSALHQAGAAALTELLQFPAPATDPRTLPCSCGQSAHYGGLRFMPGLSHRSISRRCRTGHREHGILSRGTAHAGAGGPSGPLRSRP